MDGLSMKNEKLTDLQTCLLYFLAGVTDVMTVETAVMSRAVATRHVNSTSSPVRMVAVSRKTSSAMVIMTVVMNRMSCRTCATLQLLPALLGSLGVTMGTVCCPAKYVTTVMTVMTTVMRKAVVSRNKREKNKNTTIKKITRSSLNWTILILIAIAYC